MASSQRNVDFILEQLTEAGDVSARKMFGEYGIYRGGKIVALFCDNQLFVKPTAGGQAFIGKVTYAPPYPGAKPWLLITGDHCEDGEWLSELIRITENELPRPSPKAAKSAKTKAKTATTKRRVPEPKSGQTSTAKSSKKKSKLAKSTR